MKLEQRISELFGRYGQASYEETLSDSRREPVSSLAHALQCAQLAEWADSDPSLVVAALLHDIGHFIETDPSADDVDDVHELRAIPWLSSHFGPDVCEPIRLHVQAKRYLVASDPKYMSTLTNASLHSLTLQGGPMCADEMWLFEQLPYARDAVALRRWDDMAKEPGKRTPPLAYYLGLVDAVMRPGRRAGIPRARPALHPLP